jgi:ComF family protein
VAAPARVQHWVTACLGAVDALVYPWACQICGADLQATPFCESCRAELLEGAGRTCPRCALPVGPHADCRGGCSECRGRSLGFEAVVALGPYSGPIRALCLELKHERRAWLGRWLSELLVDARAGALAQHEIDCVVPVPLHWRRRLSRGYNQAESLAESLSRRLALKHAQPIRRVVATPPLAWMSRRERARVMHGAFRAKPHRAIRGRSVLLVDDILTTGATCGAAARALKRAGARRVIVAVIGRAEGRP